MLSVVQIRALKPGDRPYKVADADGLYGGAANSEQIDLAFER